MTNAVHKLLADASGQCRGKAARVLREIRSPDWKDCDSIYGDWAFCVPESVAVLWDQLPLEAKLVAYLVGAQGAELISEPADV